jgi:DedD protein
MGLLSIFKRKDESPAGAAEAPDAVAAARQRARRRLTGATVLLGIGVIGFPLLFETQPRPIPIDIPIEIPRKDNAPPLTLPPARPASGAATAAALPTRPASVSTPAMVVERVGEQGHEIGPVAAPAASAATRPASTASARPASAAAAATRAAAAASTFASGGSMAPAATSSTTGASPSAAAEAARAQALLEGRAAASEAATVRIVVQVGAYTDADKLREARAKVEKLGLKTYTQVIEVDGSKRTRVRVGPFESRDEAEKTAARIRATGLPVALLVL